MAEKKTTTPEPSNPRADLMKAAKEIRSKANLMTDDQREESLRHGMQLIYGGNGGVPAKTGRP
jgi:hypothetical protein